MGNAPTTAAQRGPWRVFQRIASGDMQEKRLRIDSEAFFESSWSPPLSDPGALKIPHSTAQKRPFLMHVTHRTCPNPAFPGMLVGRLEGLRAEVAQAQQPRGFPRLAKFT